MANSQIVERIYTDKAPSPAGHYAQATAFGDLIFVSGQLAASPDGTSNADAPFEVQVRRALRNMLAIIDAAGGTPETILKVNAYIAGVEHWPAFNRIFAEELGDSRPARAVIPVPELHYGYLIELDAIAVRN